MDDEVYIPKEVQEESDDPVGVARERFISRQLDTAGFLKKLLELDHEDPERSHAPRISDVLEDDEVKTLLVETMNPSLKQTLLNLHMVTLLHVAQDHALQGGTDAIAFLDRAIAKSAKLLEQNQTNKPEPPRSPDYDRAMYDYLCATRDYLKGDLEGLRENYASLKANFPDDKNTHIIGSLVSGLEERENPDYKADYMLE